MSNEALNILSLTTEQVNYLRVLVAGDVADRAREIRNMRDPNDPDRFENIRRDAETARNTGAELLAKLYPTIDADKETLDIPLFLRRNQAR